MTEREPIHERLLRAYAQEALLAQDPRKQPAMARLLQNPKTRRIVSQFDTNDEGRPIADSLTYRLDLLAADGWATLCTIHWSRLGLEWADVLFEVRSTLRQQEEGTYPGGPADSTALPDN